MLALSGLRDTYWGADFVFEMFQRAQNKLVETCLHSLQDKVPEVASLQIQTEAAAGITQTMLSPSDSVAPCLNRRTNLQHVPDETPNSYGASNTVPSRSVSPADALRYS